MPRDPNRPRRPYNSSLTPAERSALARAAINARWAREPNRVAATRAGREAARARFYAEADRLGVTDPELRDKMARNAEQAEMARLRAIQLRQARHAAAATARAGDAA